MIEEKVNECTICKKDLESEPQNVFIIEELPEIVTMCDRCFRAIVTELKKHGPIRMLPRKKENET